jgi:hypothetical protein
MATVMNKRKVLSVDGKVIQQKENGKKKKPMCVWNLVS